MSLFLNDELQGTSPKTANGISFDKTGTSLKSTDVQSAIAETDAKIGSTTISSIGDGTVTGAISTVNSKFKWNLIGSCPCNSSNRVNVTLNNYNELLLVITEDSGDNASSMVIIPTINKAYVLSINSSVGARISVVPNRVMSYSDLSGYTLSVFGR